MNASIPLPSERKAIVWIADLSDAELSSVIESTGAMSARLYAVGEDDSQTEATLDLLYAEFDRRMS